MFIWELGDAYWWTPGKAGMICSDVPAPAYLAPGCKTCRESRIAARPCKPNIAGKDTPAAYT